MGECLLVNIGLEVLQPGLMGKGVIRCFSHVFLLSFFFFLGLYLWLFQLSFNMGDSLNLDCVRGGFFFSFRIVNIFLPKADIVLPGFATLI